MAGQSHTISLPILAFNDVYRVEQKYNPPTPSTTNSDPPTPTQQQTEGGRISVAQFARTLLDIRDGWKKRDKRQYDGMVEDVKNINQEEEQEREGLVLFAGDGR
jgi:5'-nucleotidase